MPPSLSKTITSKLHVQQSMSIFTKLLKNVLGKQIEELSYKFRLVLVQEQSMQNNLVMTEAAFERCS